MKRPRPKYQVFVSSTYRDLSVERERVIWGILNARHIPAGMENFTATTDRGWETIRRVIDLTDYYVVILAGMYGTVDESTGKSWTHKEYEYAVERGIPVLAFIRTDASITHDKTEKKAELREKLEAFKTVLKDKHLFMQWSDADDLASKVVESLRNHISDDEESDRPRPGWYRGDALGFSPNVTDELARLSAENNALRRQVEELNASNGVAFELLDVNGAPLATYEESRPRLVFEDDTPERMELGIRVAPAVFGRDPTPNDYTSFLEGTNRSLKIEVGIKNAGSKPAKSVVVDFSFDNCEDVSLLSLAVPQNQGYGLSAPRIVPKWKMDPNEHAYVDSCSARDDEGSIRQRVKLIAPGVNENLVSFWIRAKDAEQDGWSSVCTYSITDSEGATLKGKFQVKVSFDKRKSLNKKQIEKEFK